MAIGRDKPHGRKQSIIPLILAGIIAFSIIASFALYSIQLRAYSQIANDSIDNLKADLTQKSYFVSELASQHVLSIKKVTQILPHAKSFQSGEYDRIKLLLDAAKSDASESVDSFFILDKDGVLRYSTAKDPEVTALVGTSLSSNEAYTKTRDTMKPFISMLTLSFSDNSYVFYVASPIIDQQTGEFEGTVSAVIHADTFAKSIEKLVVANSNDIDSSSLSLIDPEGKIMYTGSPSQNLGKNVLSDEILGALPSGIKEGLTDSLREAVSGAFGIYELDLAAHPDLGSSTTPNNPFDYILISYRPVMVDNQIVMISLVTKSASLHDLLYQNGILQTSYIFVYIYAMLASMTAFAVAIIVINRKLSGTVERKTKDLLKSNEELVKMAIEITDQDKKLREVDIEKEEFSAMITHELKTPLVPVIGYSELLLDGTLGPLNEKQKETVQVVNSSALSLSTLISDLLDVRKLELGKMKFEMRPVIPEELIKNCVRVLKPLAQAKHVTLVPGTISNESDGLSVMCDSKRINQVLGNLVNNGIKFVSANTGKVEISVNKKEDSGDIIFSIKDNGAGIPTDKQQNIFKKFYQADTSMTRNAGGTGLGLAICKAIMDAHGGKIWFESEPGVGTTFYFSLPPSLKSPTTSPLGINSKESLA
jgi:signal transduction histidine kinase